jgi:hypothetical protein
MFIKPNEFEQILVVQDNTKSTAARLAVGSLFLILLVPVTLGWWALMLAAVLASATLGAIRGAARLVRQTAQYAGMLVIG